MSKKIKTSRGTWRLGMLMLVLFSSVFLFARNVLSSTKLSNSLKEDVNSSNLIFIGKVVSVEPVRVAGLSMSRVRYVVDELLLDSQNNVSDLRNLELHLTTSLIGTPKPVFAETALWILSVSRSVKGSDVLLGGGQKYAFQSIGTQGKTQVFSSGIPVRQVGANDIAFTTDTIRAVSGEAFTAQVKSLIRQRK